ncbi:uncharacterized protein [Spinacia oleracea]|uniref:holo-[acyl-carrier-protein] synthase n=1 Tax=Spinacia oleracea TaxID=3562 RepID=A0A9R0JS78_SPIOL|nr:uncharacterized protein LOC110784518 isoform X1 [Spinacia oleracea]XP_021844674.1 uncharacterized protein LOC110784518 isoform X1 [Spinacia oleracea]
MRCFNSHFPLSSKSLHTLPLPPRGETHLWYVIPDEVKCSSLLKQYLEILSPCEKQNVLSFCDSELRKKALLARALVRTTIARYQTNSYVDPRSLKFKKNSYGKPEVDWQQVPDVSWPPLHFNLSHTSSLIACGITTYSPIGIDVEDKKRTIKNDVMSFARRFFSPHEVEHLANILDPEIQRQEFIKLWTLKEAYVKALGRGFSAAPFKTFRIHFKASSKNMSGVPEIADLTESEITVESSEFPYGQWQFALLDLANTHYASICTENFNEENLSPMALRVWKTIPLLEDLCMSGTPSIITIGGLVKQLKWIK